MPGNLRGAVSVGVLPFSLSSRFSEVHAVQARVNEYHGGERQVSALVNQVRRTWHLAKRLTPAQMTELRNFVEANPTAAFYFYNPQESNFSWDPTGVATAGRYLVRLGSNWEQSMGMGRGDTAIDLVEVGNDADILNDGHGIATSIVITVKSAYTNGSGSGDAAASMSLWGTSFAFGRLYYNSATADYAATSQDFDVTAAVTSFAPDALRSGAGLAALSSFFFITNPGSGDSGSSELDIYDVYLTATFADATTRVFRPREVSISAGNNDTEFANPLNAVDGDAATFAVITSDNWGPLTVDGYLKVSIFL